MKLSSLRLGVIASALAASTMLSGCLPLLLGGAVVGGTLVATDRRTSGAQLDDQSIELRAMKTVRDLLGDRGHVNVTSYNRVALITGEVPNDADKLAVEQAIAKLENVRSTVNELGVMFSSSLSNRSNDTLITGKVKATLLDAGDLTATAFKVVTERNVVFLMGRVTEREAERAIDLTRRIRGVDKVVRVLEVVSEQELTALQPSGSPSNNSRPMNNKP